MAILPSVAGTASYGLIAESPAKLWSLSDGIRMLAVDSSVKMYQHVSWA